MPAFNIIFVQINARLYYDRKQFWYMVGLYDRHSSFVVQHTTFVVPTEKVCLPFTLILTFCLCYPDMLRWYWRCWSSSWYETPPGGWWTDYRKYDTFQFRIRSTNFRCSSRPCHQSWGGVHSPWLGDATDSLYHTPCHTCWIPSEISRLRYILRGYARIRGMHRSKKGYS